MTEDLKFEKALERLEKLVEELEAGNIPLEDALKKYEEGIRLSIACQKKLSQAEKKIEVLTKSLDGSLKKEPFLSEGEDSLSVPSAKDGPSRKKSSRPRRASDSSPPEEDVLF